MREYEDNLEKNPSSSSLKFLGKPAGECRGCPDHKRNPSGYCSTTTWVRKDHYKGALVEAKQLCEDFERHIDSDAGIEYLEDLPKGFQKWMDENNYGIDEVGENLPFRWLAFLISKTLGEKE